MRKHISIVMVIFLALTVTACVHNPLVKNDEVLIYERPFDFVFLNVLKAVDALPDWDIALTDQTKGLVTLINQKYWDSFDADKRELKVVVTRVSREKTSVNISSESQTVIGGGDFLQALDDLMRKPAKER